MSIPSVPLGRHLWIYIAVSFGAVAIYCSAVAYGLPNSARSVDAEFYIAASAMLPVLLLALLVRIGRAAQGVLRMQQGLRRSKKVEDELADLKTSIASTLSEAVDIGDEKTVRQSEDQLKRVNLMVEDTGFTDEGLNMAAIRTTEIVFGALLVALILASAGMGAALLPLATGHSTWLTLALTSLGLLWLQYSLVALEILSFQNRLTTNFLELN